MPTRRPIIMHDLFSKDTEVRMNSAPSGASGVLRLVRPHPQAVLTPSGLSFILPPYG